MSPSNIHPGKLYEAILTGNANGAVHLTETALADNQDPQELVMGQMIPAMDEVGKWDKNGADRVYLGSAQ